MKHSYRAGAPTLVLELDLAEARLIEDAINIVDNDFETLKDDLVYSEGVTELVVHNFWAEIYPLVDGLAHRLKEFEDA